MLQNTPISSVQFYPYRFSFSGHFINEFVHRICVFCFYVWLLSLCIILRLIHVVARINIFIPLCGISLYGNIHLIFPFIS